MLHLYVSAIRVQLSIGEVEYSECSVQCKFDLIYVLFQVMFSLGTTDMLHKDKYCW